MPNRAPILCKRISAMSTDPFLAVVPNHEQYEYAPMTTMQSVARLTIVLREACAHSRSESVPRMTSSLVFAARIADRLEEHTFKREIVEAHQRVLAGTQEHGDMENDAIHLLNLWEQNILRNNNTRWIPSSK